MKLWHKIFLSSHFESVDSYFVLFCHGSCERNRKRLGNKQVFLPFSPAGPSRDGTISEDTIRASLISAVSDKLRWRMKEEMDRAQAELNALKRTEEDLKKGHQKLEEMVTRLDQEVVSNSLNSCTI